ncbi:efflux RND transporter periplasmic adaptor subunit [Sporomusa malonica]|uniref:RND family efflux transporter, MFP subunit n=1 Tax=Sporomusa malonica TaxID=112901 RepID=A0A1W2CZ81_9FIRM|nr:efflux RND transporter periplasmic adaptor subunit [Sporomusa malonica]SMC90152.1 RND family efflux transporter, MFP subunit [Sporomusa malonica]
MSKNAVLVVITVCFMVLVAVAYGVYINVSSNAHLNQMRKTAGAGLLFSPSERRDVTPVLRTVLTLEPGWNTDVYAKTEGLIENIMVKQGDKVTAGTLVAVIESRELASQIKQARGSVYSSRASLEQAESDVKRAQLLSAKDAIDERTVEGTRFKKEIAAGQLASAEASLEQLLLKRESTNITAPHAGVVLKRYVEEDSYARPGLALVSLGDIAALKAMVPIGMPYQGVLLQGAAVGITISGIAGGRIGGTITAVTASPGLPPGNMMAEITVDNANQLVKPGAYSQVEISGPPVKNALVIPEQAVIVRDGRQLVYVVDSDKCVRLRTIRSGYSGDGWTIVLEGLKDGELVVAHGQEGLSDGMMIDMVKGRSNNE